MPAGLEFDCIRIKGIWADHLDSAGYLVSLVYLILSLRTPPSPYLFTNGRPTPLTAVSPSKNGRPTLFTVDFVILYLAGAKDNLTLIKETVLAARASDSTLLAAAYVPHGILPGVQRVPPLLRPRLRRERL